MDVLEIKWMKIKTQVGSKETRREETGRVIDGKQNVLFHSVQSYL